MNREQGVLKYFRSDATFKAKVSQGIEENRKANANIVVVDKAGNPIQDFTVEYEQLSHEFKYGANLFMLDQFETEEKNQEYRKAFAETFNLATLPCYWFAYEPKQGEFRFSKDSSELYRRPPVDCTLAYCKEKGIEPKIHCLNYCYPGWILGASTEKTKEALETWFQAVTRRYGQEIPTFEVTNETIDPLALGYGKAWATEFYESDDFVEWSFEQARKYFPNNRLMINEEWNAIKFPLNNRNVYYMQIERMLKQTPNIAPDDIGFQFHVFHEREQEEEAAKQMYNPEYLYNWLDLFGKLGKPLQLTEMTVPAYSKESADEEIQAELIDNLYRLFFSHQAMNGIVYWNLVDGYAAHAALGDMARGENKYHGALMRFDMTEKPALKVIRNLFQKEFRSNGTATAKNGLAAFRGFCGEYELTVISNGKSYKTKAKVSKTVNEKICIVTDF